MRLTITLIKEVESIEDAQTKYDIVKSKVEDIEGVTIHGSVSQKFVTLNETE